MFNFLSNLYIKIFKKKENKPWLDYYSREEVKIKFTDKTIYEYLISEVGNDLDYYAFNYFDHRITYNEFFKMINTCARALRSYGVKDKDIVTICMPNTPEAIACFYAINKIGAIADMIHPLSSPEQIKFYLKESKSRFLFLVDFNYEKVAPILSETLVYKTILISPKESMPKHLKLGYTITRSVKQKRPKSNDIDYLSWREFITRGIGYKKEYAAKIAKNSTALILHSGGTTGTPKGIMISNESFNAETQQCGVNVINLRPKDKIVTVLPIFHGFGLGVCVHTPLCYKIEVILMPEYNDNRFYKIWKNLRPHVILGVPTLWQAMISNKKFKNVDMSQLKYMVNGGDHLSVAKEEEINKFLKDHGARIEIAKGYGMTETVAATCYTFPGTNDIGSIGIPMVGNNYKIIDPETNLEVDYGVEGEICVNGPTLMQGYLNNESETKNILRKHSDGEYYLHTGDIGYIKENGIVYFTQRLKRMLIVSGFNVYPSMIESVIEKHPAVKKCCVIGVKHKYKMEVPKAFIILEDGYNESAKLRKELKELCKEELAIYSVPKYFEFRDNLPMTLYNKIDFKKLEQEESNKKDEL